MFIEDSGNSFLGQIAVPDAVRVNDQPWATVTNTEAFGVGSLGGNIVFLDTRLEKFPQFFPLFAGAAVRATAEEEVVFGAVQSES